MRVLNLILHIITSVLMLPDLLYIGIAFLWGVQYLKGLEMIFVPMFVLLFFLAFAASTVGAIIQLRQAAYAVATGSMTIDEAVAGYGTYGQ